MQQDPSRPATEFQYPTPSAAYSNGYPQNSATVYPYQNYNPHFTPQPNPRTILMRRLFIVLMVFIVILGFFLFLSIHTVRPQLPEVYINSLSVSNFNVSNNQLTGNWDFQLQFQNPNSKMSLSYDSVHCFLYYHREDLSETRLRPFDQKKKDLTPINATLSVSGTYIDERLAEEIGKERGAKGIVEFDLRMISLVTFRYGAYWKYKFVRINCDDVALGVPTSSNSGKMVDSSKRCISY